jgi:hypothetical protein
MVMKRILRYLQGTPDYGLLLHRSSSSDLVVYTDADWAGCPDTRRSMSGYVRNRTLTLIEREDDTRSWDNFLIYFSHSTTMSCPPRGWRYILIGC